jgi:GNAT superfamily N-acetyltransferase
MQTENTDQILIREANLTDAQRIAALCDLLGYPTSEEKVSDRLKSLASSQEHIVYVAYLPNEPILGWVHAHVLELVILEKLAVIFGLIVDPNYQRCGAGRLLMQCAEQWAKEQGCESILVRSNVMRQEAHEFYEKIGYVRLKTQLVLSKELNK